MMSYTFNYILKSVLFFAFFCLLSFQGAGQTIQTKFGKNRVQYHDDFNNWWMYETDHFAVFWYGKGRNIVKTVIQLAEMEHYEIQQFLSHTMNDRIRIIVYLDHADYAQSNIGFTENELESGAGRAQFYDNKIIVYFSGDHNDLRRQIRSGISKAYFHSMYNGINVQEFYKGQNNSELPSWIILGLTDFLTESWSITFEQTLRAYFHHYPRRSKNFKTLANADPVIAGHSMWYFLEAHYGKLAISDFLYYLRIHKNTKKAFEAVYGLKENEIHKQWKAFYQEHFDNQTRIAHSKYSGIKLLEKPYPVIRIVPDKDAQNLYFVENNAGRIRLIRRNLTTQKEKVLMKYGYKNDHQLQDNNYPLLCFDDDQKHLGIIYEDKNLIKIRITNTETMEYHEHVFPESVQRIYSFAFFKPGIILMSASTDGFSDLHLYDIKGRQTSRITNDFYNEPQVIKAFDGRENIFWVISNHMENTLNPVEHDSFPPLSRYGLFQLDFEKGTSVRTGFGPDFDILEALTSDRNLILKTRHENMVVSDVRSLNDQILNSKPGYIKVPENLYVQAISQNQYFYVYEDHKKYYILKTLRLDSIQLVEDKNSLETNRSKPLVSRENAFEMPDLSAIEINESLLFQTKFPDVSENQMVIEPDVRHDMDAPSGRTDLPEFVRAGLPVFNPVNAIAARLRFSFTELITKVDNQPLIDGFVQFNEMNREFEPQIAGMLLSTSVKDMFEDHLVEGGVRVAANFSGAEYFLHYHALKKRADWQYTLYRKNENKFENFREGSDYPEKVNYLTTTGRIRMKYPLDIYRSFQVSSMFRQDERLVKAADLESLDKSRDPLQRLILELAYVFDNTSSKGVNLWSGMRYKFFTAFSNRTEIRFESPYKFKPFTGNMFIAGFDFRYYLDVLRYSTLAFRSAGQSSFGTEKNIYFFGGMENSYFGKNSDAYPIPQDEQFAYMTQVGNIRGFDRNARNGSSFILFNAEFRLPVIRMITHHHIKQSYLRDLQLIGFFDLGTAWYGLTPFSAENSANSFIYEVPPAILFRIKQFNDPLIGGMGIGIRTTVYGYFVKLDYGWGIENLRWKKPILHFSVGQDF